MNRFFELGMLETDIRNMVDMNDEIKELSNDEISSKINLLEDIRCTRAQIKHILITNPFYLSMSIQEITDMIKDLQNLGFTHLNLLYETNPFFWDYDIHDLKEYIQNLKNNMSIEDIIMMIQDNPYLEI